MFLSRYPTASGRQARTAILPALALLLASSSAALGQGFGTIVGTVTDPSGAVISGANVTVTDPATGITRQETTNSQGYFVIPTLRPSTYDISISAAGFTQHSERGLKLL